MCLAINSSSAPCGRSASGVVSRSLYFDSVSLEPRALAVMWQAFEARPSKPSNNVRRLLAIVDTSGLGWILFRSRWNAEVAWPCGRSPVTSDGGAGNNCAVRDVTCGTLIDSDCHGSLSSPLVCSSADCGWDRQLTGTQKTLDQNRYYQARSRSNRLAEAANRAGGEHAVSFDENGAHARRAHRAAGLRRVRR